MKKKYVRPSTELVKHLPEVPILAGSGDGDGSWLLPGGGGDIDSGENVPVSSGAKENQFSTWEDWDEY